MSCQTKETKYVQSELNKIVGTWSINSFTVEGEKASEWRGLLKSGEILFNNCRSKNVKNESSFCTGDIQINSSVYKINYRFEDKFFFELYGVNKDASGVIKMTEEEAKVALILSGTWDIVVNDTILVAKQFENNN